MLFMGFICLTGCSLKRLAMDDPLAVRDKALAEALAVYDKALAEIESNKKMHQVFLRLVG